MASLGRCVFVAVLALASGDARLDDSADLFQVTARLHEDIGARAQQGQAQGQGQELKSEDLGEEPASGPGFSLRERVEKLQQLAQSGVETVQQLKQNSTEKLQQLRQDWDMHVKKRIAELDQKKAARQVQAEAERKAEEEAKNAEAERHAEAEARATAEKVAAAEAQLKEEERAREAKEAAAAEAAQLILRREEEKQAEELAAKRQKYGEELNITLSSPYGDFNFSTIAWSSTRLQTLVRSLIRKLELDEDNDANMNISLSLNGRILDPLTTPTQAGIANHDIVLVSGDVLDRRHTEAMAKKAWWEEMEAEAAARAKQKHIEEVKHAALSAERKRTREIERDGRMTLHFVHQEGGVNKEQMKLAVRPENWLQGSMDLVVNRLGLDALKARFLLPDHGFIVGKDTPLKLGLQPETTIIVKTPWQKPVQSQPQLEPTSQVEVQAVAETKADSGAEGQSESVIEYEDEDEE